jgi:putative ABC transport system substrate-binding protein
MLANAVCCHGSSWLGQQMQFDRMKRREFITLLGGAAAAWPLAAQAQQAGKLPTIGLLVSSTPADESQRLGAFTQRLHQLGWIDGRTITIELRSAEGRPERAHEIAAEFVRRKVDVIVTSGTPIVAVAKQVTSTIPIVFAVAGDPVGNGLVASLVRPGGNVTGLSLLQIEIAGKRLELLHEMVPGLRRLGIMGNFSNPPLAQELREVQETAKRLGLEVVTSEIRRAEDIAPAFDTLKARAEALYVEADTLVVANRTRIITLALAARLPAIFIPAIRQGSSVILWAELPGIVPSRRRFCRQDFARDETGRYPG